MRLLIPLQALAYDIEKNLKQQLEGLGLTDTISVSMRTGERNRSTLIFANTRSGAEPITHHLKQSLPDIQSSIECHHSSLDRDIRQKVEDRLKAGQLRAVVCSGSLDLGIDIGTIKCTAKTKPT